MERAIVQFRLKDAALLREAKAAIDEFVENIREKELGTLLYSSMQDINDPTQFMHYMEFADRESHQHHTATNYVTTFVKKLYPLCVRKPNSTFLEAYREVRRG